MVTRTIYIKRGNREACLYFRSICSDFKKMYNCALFYISNAMSGLAKSLELRHANETEVLHYVFTGIAKYNEAKDDAFRKTVSQAGDLLSKGAISGSMARKMLTAKFPGDLPGAKRAKSPIGKGDSWKRPSYMEYPTPEHRFLSYEQLDAIFKMTGHAVYERMPSQVNQNAVRKAVSAWKSYFSACKAYAKDPSGFHRKPVRPHYCKESEMTAWFSNQTACLKEIGGKQVLSFVHSKVTVQTGKLEGRYVRTEAQPAYGGYLLLVTSDQEVREVPVPEHPKRIMGIDLGVNNFAAVATNVGEAPFLIKGSVIKSINQWYNKQRALLISSRTKGKDSTESEKHSRRLDALSRQRHDKLRDFFYKAAYYICREAVRCKIDVIVIGHNEGQKDAIRLGHNNNQSFVSIPFCTFLHALQHAAWKYGIAIVQREESYTSKASVLDGDAIPTYREGEKVTYTFSGCRTHRGLYRSGKGILINADVNGAANTLRKEYPDAFDGKDLSFLHRTTKVVTFRDLYQKATHQHAEKHDRQKARAKHPGPTSAVTKRARWEKKILLMEAFQTGSKRYVFQKEKAEQAA